MNAREWLCSGGGGHEDGEDGIRACTLSMESAIELMDEFAEFRAAAQLAELRKESATAKKYEQKLLRELGRVMTALRCTDEFDGPDEAVRTANELVQALGEADKIRAELGFADTTPLNVWLADLRAQLAEKEREIARLQSLVEKV